MSTSRADDPLHGFLPRKVHAKQVAKAMDHEMNPFTKNPHTQRYKTMLEARRKLPLFAQMQEFYGLYHANQIIVVRGDVGSGKTTQIPQLVCYSELPHLRGKTIACTQPRNETTASAAARVADEMDVTLGKEVGYKTHFDDVTEAGGTTFLKYLTDDALLHEAVSDPDLTAYSTIILDEVQERTLATDILMALLKGLAKRRADLKIVVVMSAVPDALKLQKFLSLVPGRPAPLFTISSHSHPVEVFYTQRPEPDYVEAAIATVLMIHRAEQPGDILLFLTGDEEIADVCRKIELEVEDLRRQLEDPIVVEPLTCLPLYGSLSPAERQQVLTESASCARTPDGHTSRRVVLTTRIPESSLCVGGIVYVVDPGFSVESGYNPRIRVSWMLTSPISKVMAQERASCAGKTCPGKCFRLYTQRDFLKELEEQTHPQILKSKLTKTILTLVKLGVSDLARFKWIDAPAPEALMRALEELNYLAALDDDGNLTALGSIMGEFPLEPRLAKLLIASPEFGCSNEILTIVSMLSVSNIWLCPPDQKREADAAKAALTTVDHGDHITLLNIYNNYRLNMHDHNWARQNYLSARALIQADNIRAQLRRTMERFEIDLVSTTDERKLHTNIRKALVTGLFMQVAHKEGSPSSYLIVKDNQVVVLHPSCGLSSTPEWVVFEEFILTTQPCLRTVTPVQPEWLLELTPNYFDLREFRDGETRRALMRVQDKILKQRDRSSGGSGKRGNRGGRRNRGKKAS